MDGIIIIDKPSGMTSHDVVDIIRKISGERKVGHGGTLDPLATGVLPIMIGRATKMSDRIMGGDKEYIVTMELGVTTDTDDIDGKVLKESTEYRGSFVRLRRTQDDIINVLNKYIGTIEQIPPPYSAIKVNGKPAYKLARIGKKFQLKPRVITINKILLEEIALPFITLKVECSKGTYIRSLVRDIGEDLGVGACVTELRRTRSGKFEIKNAHPLNEISTLQDVISMLGEAQRLWH